MSRACIQKTNLQVVDSYSGRFRSINHRKYVRRKGKGTAIGLSVVSFERNRTEEIKAAVGQWRCLVRCLCTRSGACLTPPHHIDFFSSNSGPSERKKEPSDMEEQIENSKLVVLLDGQSLSLETLDSLRVGNQKIGLSDGAWKRVEKARSVVDDILQRKEVVYGINTGFGNFADVVISPDKLQRLQENLIRSHAAGVGDPLSVEQTRALLVLRINCLAKGHSGISRETLEQLIEAFNHSCLSFVPQKVFLYSPQFPTTFYPPKYKGNSRSFRRFGPPCAPSFGTNG